ncbi:hypothetical protein CYMTET_35502, partial [Cymbomonas tetramitiformis]
TDNGNGTHTLQATVFTAQGVHELYLLEDPFASANDTHEACSQGERPAGCITLGGAALGPVTVRASVALAARSVLKGSKQLVTLAGAAQLLVVQARDTYGNDLRENSTGRFSLALWLNQSASYGQSDMVTAEEPYSEQSVAEGDGTYTISWAATHAGTYTLCVTGITEAEPAESEVHVINGDCEVQLEVSHSTMNGNRTFAVMQRSLDAWASFEKGDVNASFNPLIEPLNMTLDEIMAYQSENRSVTALAGTIINILIYARDSYDNDYLSQDLRFASWVELLEDSAEGAEACVDNPWEWMDACGDDCGVYEAAGLCASGAPSTTDTAAFERCSVDNVTAVQACCACGGGKYSVNVTYEGQPFGNVSLGQYLVMVEAPVVSTVYMLQVQFYNGTETSGGNLANSPIVLQIMPGIVYVEHCCLSLRSDQQQPVTSSACDPAGANPGGSLSAGTSLSYVVHLFDKHDNLATGFETQLVVCVHARCQDAPAGWVDSAGRNCSAYEAQALCTAAGGVGTGFADDTCYAGGTCLADYSAGGKSAAEACCACGGGDGELVPDLTQVLLSELGSSEVHFEMQVNTAGNYTLRVYGNTTECGDPVGAARQVAGSPVELVVQENGAQLAGNASQLLQQEASPYAEAGMGLLMEVQGRDIYGNAITEMDPTVFNFTMVVAMLTECESDDAVPCPEHIDADLVALGGAWCCGPRAAEYLTMDTRGDGVYTAMLDETAVGHYAVSAVGSDGGKAWTSSGNQTVVLVGATNISSTQCYASASNSSDASAGSASHTFTSTQALEFLVHARDRYNNSITQVSSNENFAAFLEADGLAASRRRSLLADEGQTTANATNATEGANNSNVTGATNISWAEYQNTSTFLVQLEAQSSAGNYSLYVYYAIDGKGTPEGEWQGISGLPIGVVVVPDVLSPTASTVMTADDGTIYCSVLPEGEVTRLELIFRDAYGNALSTGLAEDAEVLAAEVNEPATGKLVEAVEGEDARNGTYWLSFAMTTNGTFNLSIDYGRQVAFGSPYPMVVIGLNCSLSTGASMLQTSADGSECLCRPGHKVVLGGASCQPCPKGEYTSTAHQSECLTCATSMTTLFEASSSALDCVCTDGYYQEEVGKECYPCPDGAICTN